MEGARYLRDGFRMIRQPGLRIYVWLPLVINALFFTLVIGMGARWVGPWIDQAVGALPAWLDFLDIALWILFILIAGFLLIYTFVFFATLVGAPFYGLLADKVLRLERPQDEEPAMRARDWAILIPRTLWRELRKLMSYLPGLLLLGLLWLTPGVNVLVPILWMGFSAWMMAYEFLDFPADARGQSLRTLRRRMRRHRRLTLEFGLSVWVLTLVPILNLIVLQAAVAGAVRLWLRLEAEESA